MIRARLLLAAAALASVCCDAAINEGARPGFAVEVVNLCDPGTDSVPVNTGAGGVLTIELIDRCGAVVERCAGPDTFGPDAQASIRTAGSDVLLEGCALSAIGAERLRAVFAHTDTSEVESYEIQLSGDCIAGGPVVCGDGGPPPPPLDAGPIPADAGQDAAGSADASLADV